MKLIYVIYFTAALLTAVLFAAACWSRDIALALAQAACLCWIGVAWAERARK